MLGSPSNQYQFHQACKPVKVRRVMSLPDPRTKKKDVLENTDLTVEALLAVVIVVFCILLPPVDFNSGDVFE